MTRTYDEIVSTEPENEEADRREMDAREEDEQRERYPERYSEQLYAGTNALTGKALWHQADDGYFCGHHYHRTPEQLLAECQSTISG